jgi:hypothetical protein
MPRQYTTIAYECPACSTVYQLAPGTNKLCESCLDVIEERHTLMPQVVLHRKLEEIRKRKGK